MLAGRVLVLVAACVLLLAASGWLWWGSVVFACSVVVSVVRFVLLLSIIRLGSVVAYVCVLCRAIGGFLVCCCFRVFWFWRVVGSVYAHVCVCSAVAVVEHAAT